MRKFASLLPEERKEVFQAVSVKKGLRKQEPDTYYWEPDATYRKLLEQSVR